MLYPDYYYESIFIIPYQVLWDKNIRGLIFDLDNTLIPYEADRPSAKVVALIKRLQRIGFKICLLSNNTHKRLGLFNENLGLPSIHGAMTPLTGGINRAMQTMGTDRAQTAIIGDQILTDIWGGRNARITTILVNPISKKDIITVKLKRGIEQQIIKSYLKKTGINKP